jgi:chromosome segregation ATPase
VFGKKDPAREVAELREQRANLAGKLQGMVQALAERDEAIERKDRVIQQLRTRVDLLAETVKKLREGLDIAEREVKSLRRGK